MLKSASVLAAAVLAAAGFAGVGSAQAQTITAGTSFTLSGDLQLSQSTTVTCAVTLSGSTNAGGTSATITSGSFAPGDWQCGWLVAPSSFPWTVSLTGGTGISISGIGANSILGNCSGVVGTSWTNPVGSTPSSVSFSNHSIPGSPSTCYITGTLTSSPNLTVTP